MSEIPLPYRRGAYNNNTSKFNWFTSCAPRLSILYCVFEWVLSLWFEEDQWYDRMYLLCVFLPKIT